MPNRLFFGGCFGCGKEKYFDLFGKSFFELFQQFVEMIVVLFDQRYFCALPDLRHLQYFLAGIAPFHDVFDFFAFGLQAFFDFVHELRGGSDFSAGKTEFSN